MTINYLILLLPFVCTGFKHDGITIKIILAPTEADVDIGPKGVDYKVATDSDLVAFNLNKNKLYDVVARYSGEKPTDVFTRRPTPWGNLYETYHWDEVHRDFLVKDIKVVNVTIVKKTVGVREFPNVINDTEIELIGRIRKYYYHDFVSKHHWSGNTKVPASVKYLLVRPNLKYPPDHEFLSEVGRTLHQTGINVVGSADVGAAFTLQPGQKAMMYLEAITVVTSVRVQYETVLSGDVVVNYKNKHDGHHFWPYDVNKLLAASNMATRVVADEFVEIEYVKDIKPKVVDVSTGADMVYSEVDFTKEK